MRARAELILGDRLRLVEDPPLGFRATPAGIYQVGTAGGPAGDDDIELSIRVAAGRRLRLRSVAATVVYAGTGTRQRTIVDVGAGAGLDWVAPTVVTTTGCHHDQKTVVCVADGGRLDLTEVLVLGRHGEEPGSLRQRLVVDVAGRPLLRHHLAVGPDVAHWRSPAVLGDARAVGLRLVVGPDLVAPSQPVGEGWAWSALDGPGWLLIAAAADHADLQRSLARAGPPGGAWRRPA